MAEKQNPQRRSHSRRDPTDDKPPATATSSTSANARKKGDEKLEGWLRSKELQPPR